jgi:hypothetical protein
MFFKTLLVFSTLCRCLNFKILKSHLNFKLYFFISILFPPISDVMPCHCTDEQHAMSSHLLQSAFDADGGICENVL